MIYQLTRPLADLRGRITLAGSKSISNRVLIIRALCAEPISIQRLANAKDTQTLEALLANPTNTMDVGAAGTTFRFLTAYLTTLPDTQILTGSERMQQRPIGVLVDALRSLGADIAYVGQEGYPPLRIGAAPTLGHSGTLTISAATSSQYISALLMLAPTLPQGLTLTLEGQIVSRPYILMTLRLMAYFGVQHSWEGQTIHIAPQAYVARPFTVEADWSAASYYYSMAALANEVDLHLEGLFADSTQGDAAIVSQYRLLGIETTYTDTGVQLRRVSKDLPPVFEYDFIDCPDVAQTLAVTCAALGVSALFTGLETLRIKETDRIAALKTELAKVGVSLAALPPRFNKKHPDKQYFMLEGKATLATTPVFATYEDHRMAMSFAPLAQLGTIRIAEPMVVVKSYPDFYRHLEQVGVVVTPS